MADSDSNPSLEPREQTPSRSQRMEAQTNDFMAVGAEATALANSRRLRTADVQAARDNDGLREKLEWLMLFRLVLVTFLLGSAVVVNVNDVDSFSDPSYVAIVSLIIGTYVATLGYAFWLRNLDDPSALAYVQLVGDAVLALGLVLLTGGIDSIFTFLFFLTIFNGAVVHGRPGAMFAASCSSLGLAAIVVLQFGDFEFVYQLLPDSNQLPDRVPVYALIIHLVGFFTVAALSGYLAEKLGQIGTELEKRQLDIRELRALNENIVRSLASGLITIDLKGRTIFFNPTAEEITGFSFTEVNMRPIAEVIPELADIVAAAPAVAELATRPRFEITFTRQDGTQIFLGIAVSPLKNALGDLTGHIMVFQDVTELKNMREAILRQEHLSALGKLSAAIAHEIRNPLASISGSIELLGMSFEASPDDQQLMNIVIREVDRLNLLIEDFLAYARPGQTRRRRTRVTEMVADTLRIFENDAALTSDINIVLGPELSEAASGVELFVDGSQIQQVLWNLLRNACEAMPNGGTITLRQATHREPRSGREFVSISVSDTGTGLSDQVMASLFEPFFTTKENGTGLGLATCHRIVSTHKGRLSVESAPGKGAKFVVSLPIDAHSPVPLSDTASVEILTELIHTADVAALGDSSISRAHK